VTSKLVVFACGNPSRGDDALGPALLARLEAAAPEGVTTIEDYQLQIEHALDLVDADLALFIDAGTGTPGPFGFHEAHPRCSRAHTSHALAPEDVLDVYRQVVGGRVPEAFVLCVRGESFGLGEAMSPAAERNLDSAWTFLDRLTAAPDPRRWRQLVRSLPERKTPFLSPHCT
jgi:hydrogenase maturation protease